MSLYTIKPVACGIPPAFGANGPKPKLSKVAMLNRHALPQLQAKEKEKKSSLRESFNATSRREIMQLTSVGLLSLLLPPSAGALPTNADMRQKIMEKFEELKQKAGLSKPKDDSEKMMPKDEGQEKEKTKPKANNGGGEEKSQNHGTPNGEISVPTLPNIIIGKIVETTLP